MRGPLSIENAKTIARMVFKPESTICQYCGTTFAPTNIKQRFCSVKCKNANYWRQVRSKK